MRPHAVGFIVLLVWEILAAPLSIDVQGLTKVYRIGMLRGSSPVGSDPTGEAFRQGMRDLGYIEGQHFVLEVRWGEGSEERLHDLAAELVRLQVDVIVAAGTSATRAAQHATSTIPIVMTGTSDPVGQGLVDSLAHPGGNTTGMSLLSAELPGKRLEILKETVPQSTRVAVLVNPVYVAYEPAMKSLTVAARALELQLHVVELRRPEELDDAFTAMTRAGVEALIVLEDALLLSGLRGRTVDLAAKHRLPTIYYWKPSVVAGGLMSYGPSPSDMSRRVAYYVDRILKGAKPADLPVEQPTKFEFVINLKAARALGLAIPPSIFFRPTR